MNEVKFEGNSEFAECSFWRWRSYEWDHENDWRFKVQHAPKKVIILILNLTQPQVMSVNATTNQSVGQARSQKVSLATFLSLSIQASSYLLIGPHSFSSISSPLFLAMQKNRSLKRNLTESVWEKKTGRAS